MTNSSNSPIISKDHYEMMDAFEKTFSYLRLDREPKELWKMGVVYQDGNANNLFLAYRHGVSYGRATA